MPRGVCCRGMLGGNWPEFYPLLSPVSITVRYFHLHLKRLGSLELQSQSLASSNDCIIAVV